MREHEIFQSWADDFKELSECLDNHIVKKTMDYDLPTIDKLIEVKNDIRNVGNKLATLAMFWRYKNS